MNCFQKLLSSWWRTTKTTSQRSRSKLWIAFKNYYLRDEEQLCRCRRPDRMGCELLSKIIIFVMKNNTIFFELWSNLVVNCFQKLLSSWWRTTLIFTMESTSLLWIAFKNYYLRDEEQPTSGIGKMSISCELLSKIIIFVMKNNNWVYLLMTGMVVNCFQKLLSSWWRTTRIVSCGVLYGLWIAFKNYYLRDEEQQGK